MATVKTVIDTTVAEVSHVHFKYLSQEISSFSINLSNTIGNWLKGELSGKPARHKLGIIAFIRTTPVSSHFAKQISAWLLDKKSKITVYTDRLDEWKLFQRPSLVLEHIRHYLKNDSIEHLLIPIHLVSADLISGNEIVRSSGNIVDAILESINHPLLGKPIYRDGLSLVDGGVLNNVPSSVLRQYKIDYVLSVDVGAKISETFGKNTSNTTKADMRNVKQSS